MDRGNTDRGALIAKLDELLEFGDRRIVDMHKPGRMPVSEGSFPAIRLTGSASRATRPSAALTA
jgi:hypothetical protein